jgi:hypothetical protein
MEVKRIPEWNDITFELFVQRIGHVHAPLSAALRSNLSIRLHCLRLPLPGTDVAGASARQHRASATVANSC